MAVQWETLNIACVVYNFTQNLNNASKLVSKCQIPKNGLTFREGCDEDAGGNWHLSPHLSKEEEAALPTDRTLLSHDTFETPCGTAA